MNTAALSLTKPWANPVSPCVLYETRSWRTWHRGPLLIHAARAFPRWARDLCNQEPFAGVLLEAGYAAAGSGPVDPGLLPLGKILAVCNLKHCVRIGTPGIDLPPPEPERSFGDYAPGRYAWMLSEVQPLPEPIAASGSMGLWVPDEDVLALLAEGVAWMDGTH